MPASAWRTRPADGSFLIDPKNFENLSVNCWFPYAIECRNAIAEGVTIRQTAVSQRRMKTFIKIFSGLLLGGLILCALLAWRLSTSPVSLNFATPFIERNFSAVDKSYVVRVDETVLIWDGWRRPVDIRARNIEIFSRDGKLLVSLPQVSIGLSMRALVKGRLAVATLGIRSLRGSIARFPDGVFTVDLQPKEGKAQNIGGLLKGAARELSGQYGSTDGPLGYLKRVNVIQSQLTFDDRLAGIVWHSPRADIVMSREAAGLKTDAAIVIEANKSRANLFAQFVYEVRTGEFLARTRFENLNPSLVARSVSGLNDLANFNMLVTGEVAIGGSKNGNITKIGGNIATPVGGMEGEFEIDPLKSKIVGLARFKGINVAEVSKRVSWLKNLAGLQVNLNGSIGGKATVNGDVNELEFNLASGSGTLDIPYLWESSRKIKQVRLKGNISNDLEKIEIAEALVDFGGPKIEAEAQAERIGGEARVQINANLFDLPFGGLTNYWPKQLAQSARRWVTRNIRNGFARETNLKIVGWMPGNNLNKFKTSSVKGTMRYEDLKVAYWSPLPKIEGAGGTATFSDKRFDMVISSGTLRDIQIDQAQVNMYELDTDNEQISVDVLMRGPLRTALEVLDHRPLGYIRELGLSAGDVSGSAAIRLRMDFPLDTNVDRDELTVRSSATLKDVAFAHGPFGLDIRNGHFKFKMVEDEMSVRGPARINGAATQIVWREFFSEKHKIKSDYSLRASLDSATLEGLGILRANIMTGAMSADVKYAVQKDGNRKLKGNIDFSKASLDWPEFGLTKEVGTSAAAQVRAEFDQNGVVTFASTKFSGEGSSGSADLKMNSAPDERWKIKFNQLTTVNNRVDGVLVCQDDGVYAGSLGLDRFDVQYIMEMLEDEAMAENTKPPIALNIDASIGLLSWGIKRKLQGVDLSLRFDNNSVQKFKLSGGVGKEAKLLIDFQPFSIGYKLSVETDDFGASLKALDIAKNVSGGKLIIKGERPSLNAPMEGEFIVSKYRLRKVPLFARIFQIASLTGIVDAFDREGLEFDTLEGRYAYESKLLRLDNTRTFGSSIGITTEGTLNLKNDSADLGGALIPAYTLNRILGQIPLLGPILTGGDDEGLFAATYSVRGALADPDVSVNPLSALAPGLLRKFLGVFDAETGDPNAPAISNPDSPAALKGKPGNANTGSPP